MKAQAKTAQPLKTIFRLGAPLIAFFFIQNLVNLGRARPTG